MGEEENQKQNIQRHNPDKTKTETKRGCKPLQSQQLIGFQETTGTTSRKSNLDFVTDDAVNQEWFLKWEDCGNQELFKSRSNVQGNGDQGGTNWG